MRLTWALVTIGIAFFFVAAVVATFLYVPIFIKCSYNTEWYEPEIMKFEGSICAGCENYPDAFTTNILSSKYHIMGPTTLTDFVILNGSRKYECLLECETDDCAFRTATCSEPSDASPLILGGRGIENPTNHTIYFVLQANVTTGYRILVCPRVTGLEYSRGGS